MIAVNGPSALDRLDRDLFVVTGLSCEGINDLGAGGIADFDAATLDPATGAVKPQFQPNVTIGGPGDLLHPNRAGYQRWPRQLRSLVSFRIPRSSALGFSQDRFEGVEYDLVEG